MILRALRFLFFHIIIRLVVMIVLGVGVRRKDLLPQQGPAIIIANHNSHLDTLVLMILLKPSLLSITHPVAAADYFMTTPLKRWFSTHIMGIIPLERKVKHQKAHPLEPCYNALEQGKILIIYPEGSRGEPEQMSEFKNGVYHLASKYPDIPVIPVYMRGLGKSLPKDDWLLVPFFCDVFVSEPIYADKGKTEFMDEAKARFDALQLENSGSIWE